MPVAVHTINFRGTAGTTFLLLVAGAICFVIGFTTASWSVSGSYHEGLWESCRCGKNGNDNDWFKATQALMVIALVGLVIALLLVSLYMCVHSVSKNSTILGLVIVCFITVAVMVIGFAIYGSKMGGLNWSFALAVIGGIFTFLAGIFAIVQMRESGVRV